MTRRVISRIERFVAITMLLSMFTVWNHPCNAYSVNMVRKKTGEWSSYLLPTSINTRHIDVQKSTNPGVLSSMWTEGQQTSKIVHIEPLTP